MRLRRREPTVVLPELIEGDGLTLRRWHTGDAEILDRAVRESLEHLRPWMPWIAAEPLDLAERRRMIARWERLWAQGGDVVLGILCDGRVAGGTGLHRRRGPDTLEIGYWVHPACLRAGVATRTGALLTEAALAVPGIERVEIHHDRANVASAGVPRRLGYTLVAETPGAPQAPAEVGVDCTWRLTRDRPGGPGRRSPRRRAR